MSDRAMAIGFVVLVALAFSAIIAALVLSTREGRAEEEPTVAESCLEWTDSCTVCRRGPSGPICSTPGIACIRTAPVCVTP